MYREFAQIYDKVMRDTPYDDWVSYYERIFEACGIAPHLVLDLGCGTGAVTMRMAARGYDMIGVDSSVEMLSAAREKDSSILYLNMDMTAFELYGTVDAAVCALDGVNYITEGVERLFALIQNYLNPGGIFIFDINSAYQLRHVFGNEQIVCDEDDVVYIWNNTTKENLCRFDITFFVAQADGTYTRTDEYQTQRIYETAELQEAAEKAGLTVEGIYDAFTFAPPRTDSSRIFFVLRKG